MSDWEDVPEDLLYLLSQRLPGFTNFVRFGAVCKFWHSFTLANHNCFKLESCPWLMLSEKEGTNTREFFDISTGEVYELPLPQARGRKIIGSAHGWVMTAGEDYRLHLLNPLDGSLIELPPIQTIPDIPKFIVDNPRDCRDWFLSRATWSANPATCCGDLVVMAVHFQSGASCVSFCKPSDKVWTSFTDLPADHEVAFAGGKLYAIDDAANIFSCDISNTSAPQHALIASTPDNPGSSGFYLVKCGEELLAVERHRELYYSHDNADEETLTYRTLGFWVYRLDLQAGGKVVQVQDIGDNALFLGCNKSICLPITSDYHKRRFKKNSIYFCDDYSYASLPYINVEGGEDIGRYSLDDNSIQHFYPSLSKSFFSFPIWFTPELTAQRQPPLQSILDVKAQYF